MKLKYNILCLVFLPFLSYGNINPTAHTEQLTVKADTFLVKKEQLTLATALKLADLAVKKAKAMDKVVSVAVLDAHGQTIVLLRGDGVGVHNTEASRRKAFTASSTKTATLILGRNAKANPDTQNLANLPELLLLGGGVPIYHNQIVIGAIGVSGGGGAENDDVIARSAFITEAGITTK